MNNVYDRLEMYGSGIEERSVFPDQTVASGNLRVSGLIHAEALFS